jgi:replication factor A1
MLLFITTFLFQGNHMYGEIAGGLVDKFMVRIREGRVYELRRFLVTPKKTHYRPVEVQFIIRFGKYMTVREIPDVVMYYPLCTYALTPIDDLPRPTDLPESFTGVV